MAAQFDVIVIGAGAAGLFFGGEAGRRGLRVLALDHAQKIGEKIRISGGGRCNFTNVDTRPENFLSENPKFAISALKGFTPQDFIRRVEAAGIAWHEKKLGQLFCDNSAQEIVDMLLNACHAGGVEQRKGVVVTGVHHRDGAFHVETDAGEFRSPKLVVATGGKSIPKIGASGFGYQVAEQFGLKVVETRAGLVPLTFEGEVREMAQSLAGVSVDAMVSAKPPAIARRGFKPVSFAEGLLFTHRGLSGPSILQISSYWREGDPIRLDLTQGLDVNAQLKAARQHHPKSEIQTQLAAFLPRRLAIALCEREGWSGAMGSWSDRRISALAAGLSAYEVLPAGSEGYRTAEVTLGGVDTAALQSATMEAKSVPGLYFIGEVVDVTGWLGGYNFQWAWASAYAAARAM